MGLLEKLGLTPGGEKKYTDNIGEETVTMSKHSLGLISPFRALVCGPSSCGKSELILSILKNKEKTFNVTFEYVFYFCPKNSLIDSRRKYVEKIRAIYPHLVVDEGVPDITELANIEGHKLMIIDDMYEAITRDKDMLETMILGSHHSLWSIFVTSQSYFFQNKYAKTFLRNYTDQFLFDNKAERRIYGIITSQMFPQCSNFLPQVMAWLRKNIKNPYNRYCWIDCHPNNPIDEKMRVRTGLVPIDGMPEDCQIVFDPA